MATTLPYKRELEYIHLNGKVKFDLGIDASDPTLMCSFVIKCDPLPSTTKQYLFGGSSYPSEFRFCTYVENPGNRWAIGQGLMAGITGTSESLSDIMRIEFDNAKYVGSDNNRIRWYFNNYRTSVNKILTRPSGHLCIGNVRDNSLTGGTGLIGNLYEVNVWRTIGGVRQAKLYYPVIANDDTVKLYCKNGNEFLDAIVDEGGVIEEGPTVNHHTADLPYDYEVEYIHFEGTGVFETGLTITSASAIESKFQLNPSFKSSSSTSAFFYGNPSYDENELSMFCYKSSSVPICRLYFPNGSTYKTAYLSEESAQNPITFKFGLKEEKTYKNDYLWKMNDESITISNVAKDYESPSINLGNVNPSTSDTIWQKWFYYKHTENEVSLIDWYPVVKDGIPCFYNRVDRSFVYLRERTGVPPGKRDTLVAGPTVYTHLDDFQLPIRDTPAPYISEVTTLHSNGECWFEDGVCVNPTDKTKPFDFVAASAKIYPVIDHLGNPCFYNIVTNTYHYNKGRGTLFARDTVTTHDKYFQQDGPERLRDIPGSAVLLTGADVNYAYKFVNSLPDPNLVDTKVVLPSTATGGYSEGQVLVARLNSGRYSWKPVESPKDGVGAPTDVRSFRVGNKVTIRWKDPVDTKDKTGTYVIRQWKYTRLVRKLGGYPKGPYDGIILVQNATRDYYDENVFIDTIPPNSKGVWYYKLYAFSTDDVPSTATSSQFIPAEMTWTRLSSYIKSGKASTIFGIGDEITIRTDEPSEEARLWNKTTFVVAGFNVAKPADTKLKYSMTLISKTPIYYDATHVPSISRYDTPWGDYRQVTEGKVEKGVEYYIKDGSNYIKVDPTPGTEIESYGAPLYIRVTDERKTTGSNRWKDCGLRTWLNAVNMYEYKRTTDTSVQTNQFYFTKNTDGTFTQVDVTKYVEPNPMQKGWYVYSDYDPWKPLTPPTKITYITAALPPLIALKEIDPEFYSCILTCNSFTAVSSCYGTNSDVVEDKVSIPSYTQLTGLPNESIAENSQFQLFKNDTKREKYLARVTADWWLRSPKVDGDMYTIKYMDTDGAVQHGANLQTLKGVCLVLNLG